MILYHGTTNRYLPFILRDGLLPRSQSGIKSNWSGDIESKPNFVKAFSLAQKDHEQRFEA